MGLLSKTAIIVPCYNEAGRLEPKKFLEAITDNPDLSFIFVNDGSKDNTQQILESLTCCSPKRIFFLNLDTNQGKSEAIRQGFLYSIPFRYDYIGFWDADLSTPLGTISQFVGVLDKNKEVLLVMGARVKLLGRKIARKRLRHYLGRIFATWASVVLKLDVYDTQCGAKLFRNTAAIEKIFLVPFISRWIFDIEIIARLIRLMEESDKDIKNCLIEYPLEKWEDIKGTKLKPGDFLFSGIELVKIAFKYRRGRQSI